MDSIKIGGMNIEYKQLASGTEHEIYIYDDVTDDYFDFCTWSLKESETSAKYFKELLAGIPETDSIVCYINSNGGSVKEGIGIYNQLVRHKARKTCYVDGFANSVASLIVQAFDTRYMCLGTSMLVHEMWMYTSGNAAQLRKAAEDLENLMRSNRQVYLNRANGKITEEELQKLMEQERYLTPEECVKYGFADEIFTGKTADPDKMTQISNRNLQQLEVRKNLMQGMQQELNMLVIPEKEKATEENKFEKAIAFFGGLAR